MGNKTYTEEQVRNIIDLTWGYAYEDWQVPSTKMQDAVLKMNELGLTNSDMKQLNFVCPKCSYPTFKMHHEDFLRCHGCEWTGTHVPDSHSPNTEQTAIIYQEYKNGDFIDTLQEGDCVYNLSREQVQQLLDISGDDWFVQPAFDGLVFSGNELYPIQLEYCSELEEYNFADFKQLCENTFGDE